MTLAYTKPSRENRPIRRACSTKTDTEVGIECGYHRELTVHLYPADWIFGGANGLHPGADPRFRPTTYTYFDERLNLVYVTQTPLCDAEAVYDFATVRSYGPSYHPMYLQAERPDGTIESVRYIYDWRTGVTTYKPAPGGEDDGSS